MSGTRKPGISSAAEVLPRTKPSPLNDKPRGQADPHWLANADVALHADGIGGETTPSVPQAAAAPALPARSTESARQPQTLVAGRGRAESDMLDLLSEAVESGSESRVLSLLASGAPLEGRDRAGDTPLLQALKLEKVAVVALLLRRGANPLARDADGKTAQEIAELSPDHRMRDLFAR